MENECSNSSVWNIYTDSQAAAKAVDRPRKQSGQSIIHDFLNTIERTTAINPDLKITITWIPGHYEIAGNEQADVEAKRAAMNPSISEAFEHMPLKSSRARKIKAVAKAQWHEQWSKGTGTSNVLRRITRRTGVKAGPKL